MLIKLKILLGVYISGDNFVLLLGIFKLFIQFTQLNHIYASLEEKI